MDISPRVLILMAGMPGAGKSAIAQVIGREFGLPVLDKDVILSALLKEDVPEELAQPASYQTLFDLAESLVIHQGLSVILDSPCAFPSTLEAAQCICRAASATLIPVLCSADRDARNHRVATRNALLSQPIGVSKTPGDARERFAHMPGDTIEVNTMRPLEDIVPEVLAAIRSRFVESQVPVIVSSERSWKP